MRVVSTRVLPLPAPARIRADWLGSVTAASCCSFRFCNRFMSGQGLFALSAGVRRRMAGCSARRRERRWLVPTSEAATTQCARHSPSRRVGPKCGVCFVGRLANGRHHSPRRPSRIHPHCGPTHLPHLARADPSVAAPIIAPLNQILTSTMEPKYDPQAVEASRTGSLGAHAGVSRGRAREGRAAAGRSPSSTSARCCRTRAASCTWATCATTR